MKKIFGLPLIAAVALAATSCNDFLTQEAQDLVIPTKVEQYKEILQGEGYFKGIQSYMSFIYIFTDDVEMGAAEFATDPSLFNSMIEKYKLLYLWQPEIESDQFSDGLYAYLYTQALPATLCLEDIDKLAGTDSEREVLRGQASFQRAMAYFYLANIYGPPYNEASPDDLCVPMPLSATVKVGSYPRKTVGEVWGQMCTDIETAVNCLESYNAGWYEINYKASLLLATRIALYMEDYDKAISYGQKLLAIAPALCPMVVYCADMDRFTDPENSYNSYLYASGSAKDPVSGGILNTSVSDEILFTYDSKNRYIYPSLFDNGLSSLTYCPSLDNGLIGLYDHQKDTRFGFYFEDADPNSFWASFLGYYSATYCYIPMKYIQYSGATGYCQGMRIAELYLDLAEAYARKASPDQNQALNCLNTLLRTRILDYTDLTAGDFASNDELVQRIWDERRKELCFEELHRWWDMRRCGEKGFTREWTVTGDKYVIADHDPSFTLNFPKTERDFDDNLQWNNRPDRNPSK